ncbi:MAG: hypothetical protein J5825_04875 [Lachnospiraceae bacterium]|nr:hypothetical protein [Lachnospiraceae bacterium]
MEKKTVSKKQKVLIAVLLGIWLIGTMGILAGDALIMDFSHTKMDFDSMVKYQCNKYWYRYDKGFAPDTSEFTESNKEWPYTMFLEMFRSEEKDFETLDLEAQELYSGSFEDYQTPSRFLFSGLDRYQGIVITDKNGNVLKGVDSISVESAPCRNIALEEGILACRDQGLGVVDPKQTFTEDEWDQIAKLVEEDRYVTVVSDRYVVEREKSNEYSPMVFRPLSVTVLNSRDDSVLLELDLSRNQGDAKESEIGTDRIYFHDPKVHFTARSDFKKQQEEAMYRWIDEEQTGGSSSIHRRLSSLEPVSEIEWNEKSNKARVKSGDDVEFEYLTEGTFGPVRICRSVYRGKNIDVYSYGYTNRSEAFRRIFLTFWGIYTLLILLTVGMVCLIRKHKQKKELRKEQKPEQKTEQKGEPKKKRKMPFLYKCILGICGILCAGIAGLLITLGCIFLSIYRFSLPDPKAPKSVPQGSTVVWIRTAEYEETTMGPVKLYYLTGEYEYDEYGRCVKEIHYRGEEIRDNVREYYIYEYDDAEKYVIQRRGYGALEEHCDLHGKKYNASGELISDLDYKYDYFDQDYYPVDEEFIGFNPLTGEKTTVLELDYDENGKVLLIEGIVYDADSHTASRKRLSLASDIKLFLLYDGDWEKALKEHDDLCRVREEYVDDPEAHLISIYEVDKEGNRTLTGQIEYDEDGSLVEEPTDQDDDDGWRRGEIKHYVYTPMVLKKEDAAFGEQFYFPGN